MSEVNQVILDHNFPLTTTTTRGAKGDQHVTRYDTGKVYVKI